MSFLSLIVWVLCIVWVYKVAKDNGRNEVLAAIMGAIFGIFAVAAYYLIGKKE